MNDSFKQYLSSIGRRAKKLLWLLILLPVLTAGITYLLSASAPSSYEASSTILLGNFQNTRYTSTKYLSDRIPNKDYLTQINKEFNLGINPEKISQSLSVTEGEKKDTIVLSLVGKNTVEIEENLEKVTDGVLRDGTKLFKYKQNLLIEGFERLDAIPPNHPEYATAQKEKVEIGEKREDIQNSVLLDEVSTSPASFISPMKKAILGFLLGLFISFAILVVPEIFRKA